MTLAVATNSDPASTTYAWDLGDGSSGTGVSLTSLTHTYAAAGQYTVKLTATAGSITDTAGIVVAVNAPDKPALNFTVNKSLIKFSFAKVGMHSLNLSGDISLPAGFSPAGQTLSISVGGYAAAFTLDSTGRAKDGTATLRLTGQDTLSHYTLAVRAASLYLQLRDLGFDNSDVKTQVTVPVIVTLGGVSALDQPTLSYTARKDHSGTAKK